MVGQGENPSTKPLRSINTFGFTLIELSMVLVVIGLIVGGVLVGQDLIKAAEVRATVAQIEKYNTATNTFYGKYGGLPGDLNAVAATQFGFAPRGTTEGEGDGNGVIEGNTPDSGDIQFGRNIYGYSQGQGESTMYWSDLSYANAMNINLIDGTFNSTSETEMACCPTFKADNFFPQAKLGRGNYIYVWSGGVDQYWTGQNSTNYFGISAISNVVAGWVLVSEPGLTVSQAYGIDKKIDDGLPQSGKTLATYIDEEASWAYGYKGGGYPPTSGATTIYNGPTTAATVGSALTCYDNSTSADGQTAASGNPQHYSLEINGGAGVNCALSIQFQ